MLRWSSQEIKRRRDYYPSSKAQGGQAKNWDRIVNEIPEDKLEGEEALNSFFQQIYGRGNEEVENSHSSLFFKFLCFGYLLSTAT